MSQFQYTRRIYDKKFKVLLVLAIMFCALPITTNAESYNEEFYNEKETEIVSYDFYSEEDDKYYHLEKKRVKLLLQTYQAII